MKYLLKKRIKLEKNLLKNYGEINIKLLFVLI